MPIDPQSYFHQLQAGQASPPAVTTLLGGRITSVDVDAGTLTSQYEALASFANPAGQVQGGMLGAMLDDATAFLVTATLAQRQFCATLNLNVSFLRPARAGQLTAAARLVRRGREVCHVQAELSQEGKLVATAVATCMVVQG